MIIGFADTLLKKVVREGGFLFYLIFSSQVTREVVFYFYLLNSVWKVLFLYIIINERIINHVSNMSTL